MGQGCRESQRSYLGRPVVRLSKQPWQRCQIETTGVSRGHSTEFFFSGRAEHRDAKGVSTMSSSWDEHRRLNISDRDTAVQTKWVKPMGVVQRVEPSSA